MAAKSRFQMVNTRWLPKNYIFDIYGRHSNAIFKLIHSAPFKIWTRLAFRTSVCYFYSIIFYFYISGGPRCGKMLWLPTLFRSQIDHRKNHKQEGRKTTQGNLIILATIPRGKWNSSPFHLRNVVFNAFISF